MNEKALAEVNRVDLGLAERAGLNALVLWLATVGGLYSISPRGAVGLLLGGGLTLSFLALHLALARIWLRPGPRRWTQLFLWAIWLVKWPLVAALLWFAVKTGWASPIGVCAGAGIIPLVATVMALCRWPLRRSEGLA